MKFTIASAILLAASPCLAQEPYSQQDTFNFIGNATEYVMKSKSDAQIILDGKYEGTGEKEADQVFSTLVRAENNIDQAGYVGTYSTIKDCAKAIELYQDFADALSDVQDTIVALAGTKPLTYGATEHHGDLRSSIDLKILQIELSYQHVQGDRSRTSHIIDPLNDDCKSMADAIKKAQDQGVKACDTMEDALRAK